MRDGFRSWMGPLYVILEFLFYWTVLPVLASGLMLGAFFSAGLWLWNAAARILGRRHETGLALLELGLAVAATAIGAGLALFLYRYYLVPIASQVGR